MRNNNYKNQKTEKAYGGIVSPAKTRRALLLRPVLICILFFAMVVSSVFGITGLLGNRKKLAGGLSSFA